MYIAIANTILEANAAILYIYPALALGKLGKVTSREEQLP